MVFSGKKEEGLSQSTKRKMKRSFKPFDNPTASQVELGWTLYAGDLVELKQEKGGWAEVEYDKNKTGWILTRHFENFY